MNTTGSACVTAYQTHTNVFSDYLLPSLREHLKHHHLQLLFQILLHSFQSWRNSLPVNIQSLPQY